MSITDEHAPTEQETTIYDALTAGDHDAIEQLRDDATTADPTPPDPIPEDWLAPVAQFELDHEHAWAHYQADHEMPEPERVENTAEAVDEHNADAADALSAYQELVEAQSADG